MKHKAIIALVACAAMFAACESEETQSLEVDVETLTATTDGGEFNVKVQSNVATKTTVEYQDGSGWVFLMPSYLKGDGTILFQIGKFLDYDAERKAVATIVGDGVRKEITITQTGRPKPEATDLDLDIYNVYADVEGGTFPIAVATAGEWFAESDADWCTIEDGTAIGVGTFKINVSESTDYRYRTANVTVKAGSLERKVYVQHVGTKIGELVWANANVDDPDTFGKNSAVRGQLYQWNSKKGYPTYSANDHGEYDGVIPGFETGAKDTMTDKWAEENDPCPDGWRVPTLDEFKVLLGLDEPTKRFWFDYWMTNGMPVAGAYVGLDPAVMQTDCGPGHMGGAIFIPQAGSISRDSGKQENWWGAELWTGSNVGQTWDMWGIWMDGNQNIGTSWYGSMFGRSVRCVLK